MKKLLRKLILMLGKCSKIMKNIFKIQKIYNLILMNDVII